ncbi:MAG: NADH-quinone oxidoreductase subunit L [Nitrososphaerota archaeon]|nr:NADH-quinone oxidoreductase subunit L [Candidatus Bathyarchaeota archaeon]MDW8193964.1 NADH-quinone oxidoreductase subunit L [Nitrososphaerota archaeon]
MFPYAPWLVWLLPIISSLFIPLVSRLSNKARNCFALTVSLIALIFALSMIPDVYHLDAAESYELCVPWIPWVNISAGVYLDSLSILLACLVTFFGFIITLYSLGYMAGEEGLTRYYFFILLFIGSMTGLVLSDNFFQLFIFWEMVGLCSYSLVSFWYKKPESVRAGMKVFLMTRIGDVFLLAGICLLYVNLGSYSFHYIADNIRQVPLPVLTAAAFLMLGGAVAKSAQLPLHTWLYSAMEAPTSVSALLHSATMVKAGVYLIARLLLVFGFSATLIPMWLPSILWIGTITAFIAATLALSTPDIKGVAAYSTISQIGFMFAALGTAYDAPSTGWFAGVLHLVSHAFFQGLDFLLIGGIVHAVKTRDMRLMGGLRRDMPVTFGLSLIVLLSRAGIPPVISFFSKELAISSVLSSGNIIAASILYLSTALTFAYALRVLILVYLREKTEHVKQIHVHEASKIMLLSAAVLAALCVITGMFGEAISGIMHFHAEMGLSEVFSSSTLILLMVLTISGSAVYLTYYKKPALLEILHGTPIGRILERGYYFDALYGVAAKGFLALSNGIRAVENRFFSQTPQFLANCVIILAHKIREYVDVLAEEMLYVVTNKTLTSASKLKRLPSNTINHYIAAALIGFVIILLLIIVTMWMTGWAV